MAELRDSDALVVVRGAEVLVDERAEEPRLPARGELASAMSGADGGPPSLRAVALSCLGPWEGAAVFAVSASAEAPVPLGFAFRPVRSFFSVWPEGLLHLVGKALAVVEFEETHRFCSRCGAATVVSAEGERARDCAICTLTFYPRIPPAVIVLIERDDAILLARAPHFPPGRFGAVAGFVELGETLEEAVRREVSEEVGLTVDDVSYFGSQPWPFGRSLMVGFRARWTGGEIHPDGKEIVEARWFGRAELPLLPPKISMARKLIDAYIERDRGAGDEPQRTVRRG